jgi:tripartite-type tricarboxylate transporter receptor subunit TctC
MALACGGEGMNTTLLKKIGDIAKSAGLNLTAVGFYASKKQLFEVLSHRTMIRCHRLTERRIFEIISGNKQQHDVTVCAL